MKVGTAWPPALVVTVICFVYGVYMYHNMLPQLEKALGRKPSTGNPDANTESPPLNSVVAQLVAFHVLLFMMLVSFLKSALTPPGGIPREESTWKEAKFGISRVDEDKIYQIINNTELEDEELEAEKSFLKSLPVVERKLKNKGTKYRLCSRCDLYKPDRTHHCKICDACVLRMDHHCPWIANCVGFWNYKFFMLFLFYTVSVCAFVLVTMFNRLVKAFRPVIDTNIFVKEDLLVIVAYAFALFLFIALVGFLGFHISLVVNCLTTIEMREKASSSNPQVQHRWKVANTKYSRGSRYENWKHVMGSPWMWLLPVQSDHLDTDGTYSEVPAP